MFRNYLKVIVGLVITLLFVPALCVAVELTQEEQLIEDIMMSLKAKYEIIYDQNSLIVTTTTLPSGEKLMR